MRKTILLLTSSLLLLLATVAFAAEPLTLGAVKAAGGKAMTKAEVEAFVAKRRLDGEAGKWAQPLRLFDDGTLRGESCGKGERCSDPAKGTGKWSIDEDGTFRLFLDWGRWGSHDWVGKLYQHDGYVYQFSGDQDDKTATYRFRL